MHQKQWVTQGKRKITYYHKLSLPKSIINQVLNHIQLEFNWIELNIKMPWIFFHSLIIKKKKKKNHSHSQQNWLFDHLLLIISSNKLYIKTIIYTTRIIYNKFVFGFSSIEKIRMHSIFFSFFPRLYHLYSEKNRIIHRKNGRSIKSEIRLKCVTISFTAALLMSSSIP